ncbi:MAG TPA: MEDS domain-containing protein [Blastocatellia bacterium]|nr:MEDS domain-containing protein [Blastocatellia bacterium]
MATELRKTGISVVGDVPWGTHFCYFYETTQDLLDTLVPYFMAGLKSKEFCLWIISNSEQLTVAEAEEALGQALPDLQRYLTEGSIEIVTHDEWFQSGGAFDLHRVANQFEGKLDEALARGYVGLRVNGSPAWIATEDRRQFCEFEQQLDNLFPHKRVIASCTYPLASVGAYEIFDVTRRHQFAIAKRCGEWEVIETPELKQAKAEIARLNRDLEQRVAERTRELVAANEALKSEIDERRRTEEELRERAADLAEAQRVAKIGNWILNLRTNKVTWSEELYRIFEIEKPDFDGRYESFVSRIHPDDQQRVLRTNAQTRIEASPFDIEYRIITLNGQVRFIREVGYAAQDEAGIRLFGTAQDITERKRAEDKLRRQKEILQQIFDHIPVMINFVDADGRIKLVNGEWERTLGWSLEEIQQQNLDIFVECYPDPQYRQQVLKFLAEAEGEWADFKTRVRDGHVIDTSWVIVHLSDRTSIGIGQDITERKRAEEKLKATSEQLRALSASLSSAREQEGTRIARELHDELGSALTSLKWDLEGIDKLCSEAGNQADVSKVREKTKEMIGVIDATLNAVLRISSELRPTILDDLGLLEAIEWQAQQFEARTGITCQIDSFVEKVDLSQDKATAVFRILQEALTNVLRHAHATRVNITIAEEEGEFAFEIRDNGRGITEDERTGSRSLGLIGMRERAHLVGGRIEIIGVGERGTALTLRVPIHRHVD